MSTRSGKRIHAVSSEECSETLIEPKSVRKTRSKQEEESSIVLTNKKRKNYVRYPSEEDVANNLNDNNETIPKIKLKSRRTTLKEHNLLTTESEIPNDERKIVRITRRTKNVDVDDTENDPPIIKNKTDGKKKGSKKSKKNSITEETIEIEPVTEKVVVPKKKSNKKKKSKSNSITVEDIPRDDHKVFNKSNISVDSFHSAAGSPLKVSEELYNDSKSPKIKKNKKHVNNGDFSETSKSGKRKHELIPEQDSEMLIMKPSSESLQANKKTKTNSPQPSNVDDTYRMTSLRSSSFDQERATQSNTTFETENSEIIQSECGKKGKKSKMSVAQTKKMMKNNMIDTNLNETNELQPDSSMLYIKNKRTSKRKTTYSVEKPSDKIDTDLNTTFEKEKKSSLEVENNVENQDDTVKESENITRKKKSKLSIEQTKINGTSLDTTYEKENSKEDLSDQNVNNVSSIKNSSVMNLDDTTNKQNSDGIEMARRSLRKSIAPISSLNSTYDKISNTASPVINGTYDKNDEHKQKDIKDDKSERKSSLISSDGSDSDKEDDNCHLSITSDESRENIINTTTILIESSMDESQIKEKTPLKRQGTFTTESPVQKTPLKRQGTFTTESSEEKGTPTEKSLKREGTFNKDTTVNNVGISELQPTTPQKTPKKTPLKRQGTFTTESSEEKGTPTEKSLKREGTFNKDTTVNNVGISELQTTTPQKTPKKTPLKRQGTFTTESSPDEKGTPIEKSLKREGTFNKDITVTADGINTESKPMSPQKTNKTQLKRQQNFTSESSEDKGTQSRKALKREGTFNKDDTQKKDDVLPGTPQKTPKKTPQKRRETFSEKTTPLKGENRNTRDYESPKIEIPRRKSLPSPGCTPFPFSKKESDRKMLNVTRSIEKRKSSLMDLPRATTVKFCSPVNNPVVVSQMTRKIIKSSMKGSNKSFVFDESAVDVPRTSRKRSYTQSEVDQMHIKHKRLTEDQRNSVDRLSRPRTSSASGKLQDVGTPSKKPTTPLKKPNRTKLPNFAALHQKQFDKMESLDECQERKAKRAKQLLTPTGSVTILERISPKETQTEQPKPEPKPAVQQTVTKKVETPKKQTEKGYTRFGFKLNLDVNPFSIPCKTEVKPKEPVLKRQATLPALPSLAGATIRKNLAKQTIMREKSFTKRKEDRKENRTIIKGVRTNRRFELQMKMRNINEM